MGKMALFSIREMGAGLRNDLNWLLTSQIQGLMIPADGDRPKIAGLWNEQELE